MAKEREMRMCCRTRQILKKDQLLRFVVTDQQLVFDPLQNNPQRGFYFSIDKQHFKKPFINYQKKRLFISETSIAAVFEFIDGR